jgi:hypothetical protein
MKYISDFHTIEWIWTFVIGLPIFATIKPLKENYMFWHVRYSFPGNLAAAIHRFSLSSMTARGMANRSRDKAMSLSLWPIRF